MKVLLLSRHGATRTPSSRIRSYQYLPSLQGEGIDVTVKPLLDDTHFLHVWAGKGPKPLATARAYLSRLLLLTRARRYDLLWIEKELMTYFPAVAETLLARFGVPYVADYDDAVFHRYDLHKKALIRKLLGTKIDTVMRNAALVIVGNGYLEERARRSGAKRVEFIPTVVDLTRYAIKPSREGENGANPDFTVGWIGTPLTKKYLHLILPSLQEACRRPGARLTLVGSGPMELEGIIPEIREWSVETEVADVQTFDVGIMPLPDDPFERGKCGYKLIQYMACGVPVIASPVGCNTQIVDHGVNGFLAETAEDWQKALETLRCDPALRRKMGLAGREKVEAAYCLQVTGPRLAELLRSAAARR